MTPGEPTKTCRDCEETMAVSHFRRSSGTPDGWDIRCTPCARTRERARKQKTCSRCKQAKPKSQFSRQAMAKDGLQYQCRECCKILRRQWARTGTSAGMKVCAVCVDRKTLKSFSMDPGSDDGRSDTCFACVRKAGGELGPAVVHHHEYQSRLVEHEPGSTGYHRLEADREKRKNSAFDALRANREEVLGR